MANQSSADIAKEHACTKNRDWTRLAPDMSEVWVLCGDEPKMATVFDESYGGIGLTMDAIDVGELEPGDSLTVFYYGSPMQGSLQWIQKDQQTRQIRLGIQWSAKGGDTARTEN